MQAKFVCSFDKIKLYPFGSQTCYLNLSISGPDKYLSKFINKKLTSTKVSYELGQYIINEWKMVRNPSTDTISLELCMTRGFNKVFIVTYLPTLLMNLLNQAVVYIETENKYDLIITVNITCMMVLASVYLSVSSSLPSTSVIKPLEIWLLFNLIYPVVVIIANVLSQVKQSKKNQVKHNNRDV